MLQKNARRSYRDIGRRLGVSEATIRARVGKFRKEGIIKSFTALLDAKKVGIDQISIMKLKGSPEILKNTRSRLRTMHEIKLVYEVNSSLELIAIGYFRGINQILEVSSSTNIDKIDFKIDIEKYLTDSD
jgi:Lrp/AsnC family transcriptional regulator for asnA, asnC and gidA